MTCNIVSLIGHIGKAPRLIQMRGAPWLTFSICIYDEWKGPDGNRIESRIWVPIRFQGQQAVSLHKWTYSGMKVHIEGSIRRPHRKDGKPASIWIFGRRLTFCGVDVNKVSPDARRKDVGIERPVEGFKDGEVPK